MARAPERSGPGGPRATGLGAADEAAPSAADEAVPVEAAPVEAAPVEAAPVEAAPVEAVPVEGVSVSMRRSFRRRAKNASARSRTRVYTPGTTTGLNLAAADPARRRPRRPPRGRGRPISRTRAGGGF